MDFESLPIPALQGETSSMKDMAKFIHGLRSFPVIETTRLKLRPLKKIASEKPEAQDIDALHQILGPPDVHGWNYIFKNGFSLADAATQVESWLVKQAEGKAIGIIVEDRMTGNVVGEVHADFDPSLLAGDIGYATDHQPENRGKGYATEAAGAFIGRLCSIGLKHIILTASPDNYTSQNVIRKLGVPKVEGVILTVHDIDGIGHVRELFYLPATAWGAK